MSKKRSLPISLHVFVAILALAACTTSPTTAGDFNIAVIVDETSDPVSREQAKAIIDIANESLIDLTGFSLKLIDFVEDDSGGSIDSLAETHGRQKHPPQWHPDLFSRR